MTTRFISFMALAVAPLFAMMLMPTLDSCLPMLLPRVMAPCTPISLVDSNVPPRSDAVGGISVWCVWCVMWCDVVWCVVWCVVCVVMCV